MSNWISVKDRLPEPWVEVLCFRIKRVYVGYLTPEKEWVRAGGEVVYPPYYWQPLPEPPEDT